MWIDINKIYENCPICKNLMKIEKGNRNFYEGLYYCNICDEYYTENLNKV